MITNNNGIKTLSIFDELEREPGNLILNFSTNSISLNRKKTILERIKSFVLGRKEISIEEFMKGIIRDSIVITPLFINLEKYKKQLEKVKETGQIELRKELEKLLDIRTKETFLIKSGIKLIVTENQIISFYEKTKNNKNIKLTFLSDYLQPLPSSVTSYISVHVKNNIFDNYVILHYDPKNIAERIKDPILFGLIKGSRKLYFITDWIDQYCDLTLEKFLNIIEEEKTFIDKE